MKYVCFFSNATTSTVVGSRVNLGVMISYNNIEYSSNCFVALLILLVVVSVASHFPCRSMYLFTTYRMHGFRPISLDPSIAVLTRRLKRQI